MNKRMDELQVGDRVRVGANTFSDVYFFGHKLQSSAGQLFDFVQIVLANGKSIVLSHSHMVLVNGVKMQAAGLVRIGDQLLDVSNKVLVDVVATQNVRKPGLFNPHTLQGDIVVNGIQASSYTNVVNPKLAHMLLAPERVLYRFQLGFMWLGSSFDGVTPMYASLLLKWFKETLASCA